MAPEDGRRHVHHPEHDRPADEPRELGEDREDRHGRDSRDDSRHDEEADGREAHRRERVKLLVDLHRADLRCERAPRAAGEHDRRHEGPKLAEERYREKVGDIHLDAEHLERGGRLEREDKPKEKADAGRDRERVERGALERERRIAKAKSARSYEDREGADGRLAEEGEIFAHGGGVFARAAADCLEGFHFAAFRPSRASAYALVNAEENALE